MTRSRRIEITVLRRRMTLILRDKLEGNCITPQGQPLQSRGGERTPAWDKPTSSTTIENRREDHEDKDQNS
jgi:hypothetical protein